MPLQTTLSPIDGQAVAERALVSDTEAQTVLATASAAQREWSTLGLEARTELVSALVDQVVADKAMLADELTSQMGRPRRYTEGEIGGFEERARRMCELAEGALAPVRPPEKDGFVRYISREPLGTVLVLAPWNYPWLTAVNAVVPALLSGNSVVLKHSDQTPLVAERFVEAAIRAGIPENVFQFVHASHETVATMVADERVDHVCFTGSVQGGRAVHRAAADRFIATGLELGGKDPAYVAQDADVAYAIENLVDGSFFNSGQSCCGVERIYVHESHYDAFVDGFVALTKEYVLGNPRENSTTLGPVVRERSAKAILAQVDAAIDAGAKALIGREFAGTELGPCYLGPEILVNVNHTMEVMQEETFGPVACIMKVQSDAEAVQKMNDSRFGLTASIWTADLDLAARLGQQLETGTVFANRCDALDPDLAWVGVKDSGRGATLSKVGFEHLTRPKSFHLRERS